MYSSPFTNKNIQEELLIEEHFPALEELLLEESRELALLQKLKKDNKLDFGRKLGKGEVRSSFTGVFREVSEFLGVQYDVPPLSNMPFFSRDSGYSPPTEKYPLGMIKLGRQRKKPLVVPCLAHECAHYVQYQVFSFPIMFKRDDPYDYFKEGHARGVQRFIAQEYKEKEDNEAFLYTIRSKSVGELKSSYLWVCKHLEKPPRNSLLRVKTSRDVVEVDEKTLWGRPTAHSIGNTLFHLYEKEQGNQIFKMMIQGTFKF